MEMKQISTNQKYFLATFLFIAVFTYISILMATHIGLCCSDDASFSIVSKNIAQGRGYIYSLNYDNQPFVEQAFPPQLGTGPVLIGFVALVMHIIGFKVWVPGVASAILNSLFLCLITVGLNRLVGGRRTLIIIISFITCAVLMSPRHVEFWYAQLGEVSAALAAIAGFVWWCGIGRSPINAVIAGVSIALGFLIKELDAIYIAILICGTVVDAIINRKIKYLILTFIGMAIPLLIFELYRLISLGGLNAFLMNWKEHLTFVVTQGTVADSGTKGDIFVSRMSIFQSEFNIPLLLVSAAAIIGLILIRSGQNVRKLAFLLSACFFLHLAYWVFKSNGWPRYVYQAMIVFSFVVALFIGAQKSWSCVIVGCVVLASVLWRNAPQLSYQEQASRDMRAADSATLAFILDKAGSRRVYTQWWAQVANLEYSSPRRLLFEHWRFLHHGDENFLLVTNETRMYMGDQSFLDLIASCRQPIFTATPYRVYQCKR